MPKSKPTTFPDRYSVACVDRKTCPLRPCMRPGQDKGSFSIGRGYTSYHAEPKPVCATRHHHGCPHPLPEPDPEVVRCCYRPTYYNARADRKAVPCDVCGATVPGWVAKLLNALPTLPGVPCKHPLERRGLAILTGWTECLACKGAWDKEPVRPHEVPTKTADDLTTELRRRLQRVDTKALDE